MLHVTLTQCLESLGIPPAGNDVLTTHGGGAQEAHESGSLTLESVLHSVLARLGSRLGLGLGLGLE